MISEEEIKVKEQELINLKHELKQAQEKKILDEKAKTYFDKNFGMSTSHDIYGIDEYYGQLKCEFIRGFYEDDKSLNNVNLKELREKYVDWVKEDLRILQQQYDLLVEQMKDANEDKRVAK